MGYITKIYLATQFFNFSKKISDVFIKKNDSATTLTVEGNAIKLKAKSGTVISETNLPILKWEGED